MSTFRTELPIPTIPINIDYQSPILCIGSCFAENIAQRLIQYKFPCQTNPFGILYNPISIQQGLEMLLASEEYTEDNLFLNEELWHSFDFHGEFSNPNKKLALKHIKDSVATARKFLQQTKRLIITFGTATIFIHKSTQKVVANCHKVPNLSFEKKRLSVAEIVEAWSSTLVKLKANYPDIEIIFTVSPIRHIRDGLIDNQLSKATLLLAIEALNKDLPFTHYFPAYELVLDDLRDYRFFEQDMIHPNEVAIQYIWEYFQKTFFTDETKTIFDKINKLIKASEHRPFHSQTAVHQNFVKKQLAHLNQIEHQFSFINLSRERAIFSQQLNP